MELLNYLGTASMLDATLKSLHAQSAAWQNRFSFWSDEMGLFYVLLHHKSISKLFHSSEIAEIDKDLVKTLVVHPDKVRIAVTSPEGLLASVFKSESSVMNRSIGEAQRRFVGHACVESGHPYGQDEDFFF